ncbi:hypothetical protein HanIR_Chr17g0892451 [Helianthus annuus]|nr:hypothetical protein HanIR_Chr17g0892451 [Helianthus annuus]
MDQCLHGSADLFFFTKPYHLFTPSPPPTVRHHLYLRRPSTSAALLQPTPTLLHHSSFSPLLLHHSSCRRQLLLHRPRHFLYGWNNDLKRRRIVHVVGCGGDSDRFEPD